MASSVILSAVVPGQARVERVGFGVDAKSIRRARDLSLEVSYGSTWAGSWNQKHGWNGIADDLRQMKANGVVPVVQWWYWGDDISPACVQNGCTDRYQGVPKNRANWTRLSNELADLIARESGTSTRALVVIETEFNKNGIEMYEAFDGFLAEQADIFHKRGLRVIIGFGNWGQPHWKMFDRAIAAADLLGTMTLQSSVQNASTYMNGPTHLIEAARYLHSTFRKPTFITDVAFSSYPSADYEGRQQTVIAELFRRMPELSAAGVEGMVWRMLADDPEFDTRNYHGQAERHWGLVSADGRPKPAFATFRDGTRVNASLRPVVAPRVIVAGK